MILIIMIRITCDVTEETHASLKIRLAQETLKSKKIDKKAPSITAQKFISNLLEKELKIKK